MTTPLTVVAHNAPTTPATSDLLTQLQSSSPSPTSPSTPVSRTPSSDHMLPTLSFPTIMPSPPGPSPVPSTSPPSPHSPCQGFSGPSILNVPSLKVFVPVPLDIIHDISIILHDDTLFVMCFPSSGAHDTTSAIPCHLVKCVTLSHDVDLDMLRVFATPTGDIVIVAPFLPQTAGLPVATRPARPVRLPGLVAGPSFTTSTHTAPRRCCRADRGPAPADHPPLPTP
ncbi:mucin-2-like [Schistocerca americana]|uniref:mucin-2-like n=1 Tax=Schistocerca americana TaxID=7009 RepID=UPI001F4F7696|nr:mucin-2-like [Schistocerca americana]